MKGFNRRYGGILFLVWVVSGCTPADPSEEGFAAAADVAALLNADHLMPWVETLAEGHRTDPKLPCDGFEVEAMYPACSLSNASARAFVLEKFAEFGYAPERLVLEGEPLDAVNIVAERRGATHPDSVVLVGAHYDAFYSGADDNSSAVAVMLEVARVFARLAPRKTVRFVGFDLEEIGLVGSHRYVEAGHADDVEQAIILEMLGYASSEKGSQDPVLGLPMGENADVGNFIAAVGNADSMDDVRRLTAFNNRFDVVGLKSVVAGGDGVFPITGQLMRSDHGSLWLRSRRALMLTDAANFRNPHYHKETDTPETLNPAFLADVARLTAATVALLAGVAP